MYTIRMLMALALLTCLGIASTQMLWAEDMPKPSANAGRKGIYKASTSQPGINYYVCANEAFTPDKPAGIHVFFHGLGGQNMAQNFQLWAPFLTTAGCIGINMEYTDGNPHDNMDAKADAAREAVRQVMADYPVVVGRGAMTAFSAGGSPAGSWFKRFGQKATAYSADWPFCHVDIFGSSLNAGDEISPVPTSWFRAMGDGEEAMAPGLYRYMSHNAALNLNDKVGTRDAILLVTKGRGHTILRDEVECAASQFAKHATTYAPFLYCPAGVDKKIVAVIDAANAHQFAKALQLAKSAGATPQLVGLINAQMKLQLELCASLKAADPLLARRLLDASLEQLKGTPLAEEAKRVDTATAADAQKTRVAYAHFAEKFSQFFANGKLQLAPGAADYLRSLQGSYGKESGVGMMATRFLGFE